MRLLRCMTVTQIKMFSTEDLLPLDPTRFVFLDQMEGNSKYESTMYLHFHPSVKVTLEDQQAILSNEVQIRFKNYRKLHLVNYLFASGFNRLERAISIEGVFDKKASFEITFHKVG